MVYSQIDENQFQPILIPIQIQPLPSNHMRISLSPSKIGTYRIYIAYRNIPINGRLSLLSIKILTHIRRRDFDASNKNVISLDHLIKQKKEIFEVDKLYVYRIFDYMSS